MEIRIESKVEYQDKISVAVGVYNADEKLFDRNYTVRTWSELNTELANLEYYLAERDTEIAKITTGKWTKPPHEVIENPLTPEEIKARAIGQAQWELDEAVEQARRNKEVAELAQFDDSLAEKLQALQDLKQAGGKKIG